MRVHAVSPVFGGPRVQFPTVLQLAPIPPFVQMVVLTGKSQLTFPPMSKESVAVS